MTYEGWKMFKGESRKHPPLWVWRTQLTFMNWEQRQCEGYADLRPLYSKRGHVLFRGLKCHAFAIVLEKNTFIDGSAAAICNCLQELELEEHRTHKVPEDGNRFQLSINVQKRRKFSVLQMEDYQNNLHLACQN